MLEFDPNNKKQPSAPVFATYVPSRRPNFKTYSRRNYATNAINYVADSCGGTGNPGILYEYIGGAWIEIDRYEPPTNCAHCGVEFKPRGVYAPYQSEGWYKTPHRLIMHDAKPAYKKPVVCYGCYDRHFTRNSPEPIDINSVGMVLFDAES